MDYYIPFTSRVDKHTSVKLTVNIREKNQIIAKLLLNNMIPVKMETACIVEIEKEVYKDYYNKEISYLRTVRAQSEILKKITNMYQVLENEDSGDYAFFKKLCCDFKLLEEKCRKWKEKNLA